jgi:hypothetical protein
MAESCLPDWTSLDVIESISPGLPSAFSLRLRSRNLSGDFLTQATLEAGFDGSILNLGFRFEMEGVSLPYNIYALLAAAPDAALAWHDLTNGCSGPGASIFPKGKYDLPHLKISREKPFDLHVIVWGRL